MRKLRIRPLALFVALIMLVCSLPLAAFADSWDLYINNPDPKDRLHLRKSPSRTAESLGKYYNGAPITALEDNGKGWVRVRVGNESGSLIGWMQKKYLSQALIPSAMPQCVCYEKTVVYQQPSRTSSCKTLETNTAISLMGFSDTWWHILAIPEYQSAYTCFIPANTTALALVHAENPTIRAYVSNPDKNDRLHLRQTPSKDGKDLGKYYNGSVGTVLGESADGKWVKVDMYGRQGYMLRTYLTLEGEVNHAYYGIPTIHLTAKNTSLYEAPDANSSHRALQQTSELKVLGLIDAEWLHVNANGVTGFVKWVDTDFPRTEY